MTPPHPNFLSRFLAALKYSFIAMTGAYSLGMVMFLLGRTLIGESWVVIAFLNTFAHLLWMPAFILFPIMLLLRQWRISLMLLSAVVLFVWFYAPQFIPKTVAVPQNTTVMKVLTYNVFAGNRDTDTVIGLIRSVDADIVALQETTPPMTEALDTAFAVDYPYRALHPGESVQGLAILSRYPIEADEYWQYPWALHPIAHQRVSLQIGENQSIAVYHAHPPHPGMNGSFFDPTGRSRELADVYTRIQAETLPVIWLGDFNMPHLSDDYERITDSMEDVYGRVGQGMGLTFAPFPYPIALLRLDYVFISPEFTAIESAVLGTTGGSDHLPLWATIALRNE